MFFRKKVPCYVLVFDQVDLIKATLESLSRLSQQLELIIIENPSANSGKIKRLIDDFGKAGVVKRHYIFDENITGNAYGAVLNVEANLVKKSPYVLLTDGDLTTENGQWLEEELRLLGRHKDIFACGVSLDLSNLPLSTFPDAGGWIPADTAEYDDFYEVPTGVHLLLFRGRELAAFMNWKNQHDLNFVDRELHRFCYEELHKKWARTKQSQAYHLTWDLYADKNHPYTRLKTGKDFETTWHQGKKLSAYTLTNY